MFSTIKEDELHFMPFIYKKGQKFWSSIMLEDNKALIQVTYHEPPDDEIPKTAFLQGAEQLERLTNVDELELIEVNLLSPAWLNKKGKWLLDPLSKIFVGSEPGEHWHDVFIYELDNGQKYIESALETKEENVTQITCVFDKKTNS